MAVSDLGRERLREAARRNQPWRSATGPRSAEGKRVSSMNALRTGLHTAERRAWRRLARRFLAASRQYREQVMEGEVHGELELLATELVALAQELGVSALPGTAHGR